MRRILALGVIAVAAASALPTAAAPLSGPLALLGGSSASGYPLGSSGPSGITIRFIDRGTFWVSLLVRNASAKSITLIGARTPEPPNSLVRQTRSGFSRYKPCKGDAACMFPSTPTSLRPLVLASHAEAAVKLNYKLVSCRQEKTSTSASASSLVLSYRDGTGTVAQESVPLGSGRLHLQRPTGVECLPRPFSYIGLVGSFTTSPQHKPIPGSGGDTCRTTASGGLVFGSREFMDRSGTMFQIEISLSRYRGIGSYGRASSSLASAEVTAVGWYGTPGPTTIFHDPNATVTVTSARGTTLGGHLTAVFSGHRRFFRAYGSWRCTTRR